MEFFISTLFIRAPNKFQNTEHFLGGFNEFQGYRVNEGHIWDFLKAFFCKTYLINPMTSRIFGWLFLVNEGQILNFYRYFIYKNFLMNFKISGFVGFTE